jgi:hypothetical protein
MKKKNDGFISLLIMIIIGLAAAKYFFGWSILSALSSPEGQGTVGYLKDVWNIVWRYIGAPLTWAWDNVAWPILDLGWKSLQKLSELGRGAASN